MTLKPMKFKEKMRSSELVHPQASDPATLMISTKRNREIGQYANYAEYFL